MGALQRGATIISASYRGKLAAENKYVAVTFDDALDSLIENALPVLAEHSLPATIFVPVGWIGLRPAWEIDGDNIEPDERVMTNEQLKGLDTALVTLGSHTVNHRKISKVDQGGLAEEIEGSRERLARLSGQNIRSLSFPYGDYDSFCVAACESAGYEIVFSIFPENVDTASSKILRGRTKVDPSDGPLEFYLKFNGGYGWTTQISRFTKRPWPVRLQKLWDNLRLAGTELPTRRI